MAIPTDKDDLLKVIVDNYKKLKTELSDIPIELTEQKELAGHSKDTLMSINNLVAYLVGWGQLILKWNDRKSKGIDVDFPETGFKWNELGQLAQKFYKDYEKDDFKTLNAKLDETTNEILKLIESKTNKELYKTDWYGKWTLGKMIQLNTSSPFKNAKDRIRKWKKAKQLIGISRLRFKMKYVAFLRGINVGGKTIIKMEELRKAFFSLGFANVKTYIQSGNVVFETDETDEAKLTEKISNAIELNFFKTPVMVRTTEKIKDAVENNPFAGEEFEDKLFHLVFLSEKLSDKKVEMLLSNNNESEKFAVRNREVYCLLRAGVANSLLGKKYIDNKLKVAATARNWRTVNKILEL